uniref:transposase n=1 Tax=Actinomadura rubrobrunea TaxID=115335 RepID=UPI001C3F2411
MRGLLLDGRRTSMQPMAERLGIDHRGLQRFMTSSPWDVAAASAGADGRSAGRPGAARGSAAAASTAAGTPPAFGESVVRTACCPRAGPWLS